MMIIIYKHTIYSSTQFNQQGIRELSESILVRKYLRNASAHKAMRNTKQ